MYKKLYKGSPQTRFKKIKLKKDDEVICIAGKEKGKKGKVLGIDKKRDRIVIEGINKRKRYLRPTQENPKGGVMEVESPMHISNVMLFDSKAKKGVRTGLKEVKGKKVRVTKPDGKEI